MKVKGRSASYLTIDDAETLFSRVGISRRGLNNGEPEEREKFFGDKGVEVQVTDWILKNGARRNLTVRERLRLLVEREIG